MGRASDGHGNGDHTDDEHRPDRFGEVAHVKRDGGHAIGLGAHPAEHFLDLGDDLHLRDNEGGDQHADDHAGSDGGLFELFLEKQFGFHPGGQRLERMMELPGIRAGLDQADDGFAEAVGATEGLMHIHAGGDVFADARQRVHDRLVRQAVAVVFEGVGGVDLGAQHRPEAAEQIDEFFFSELFDLLGLTEASQQALGCGSGGFQGGGGASHRCRSCQ